MLYYHWAANLLLVPPRHAAIFPETRISAGSLYEVPETDCRVTDAAKMPTHSFFKSGLHGCCSCSPTLLMYPRGSIPVHADQLD